MLNAEPPPVETAAVPPLEPRKNSAGSTPDPWELIARLEYGADRSAATSVREQVLSTPPVSRDRVEDKLLEALALPGCTAAGRAFICEMLALVGSARSVPALAALLRNPETSDAARYALEPIPGPEATAALRGVLPLLAGSARAGVVGSLAVRGDLEAGA